MEINNAKDIVINAGKELVKRGLIARTWGNVSQRINESQMVITPSGRDYLSLTRDDIVLVDINTLEYEGDVKPSSEKGVHAACYRKKDVNFVIHTHQEYASIVSTCNIDYMQADEKYGLLAGKVINAPYGLPSTKTLCKGIEGILDDVEGSCVIMKNHGALCFGKTYEETFEAANQLENASKDYFVDKYKNVTKEWEFDSDDSMSSFVLGRYGVSKQAAAAKKEDIDYDGEYVLNDTEEVVALSHIKLPLYPLVDDFAQLIGMKMQTVKNNKKDIEKALKKADAVFVEGQGAVCVGADADAVSMIVEKNSKAFIGASLHGRVKPIKPAECLLMRTIFKLKYSKQK